MSPARAKETVCYQCHADVRGQFELPSHHPVPEGRMDCTLCHSPHKGSIRAGGGTALLSQDDNCLHAIRPSAGLMYLNTRRCARVAPPATRLMAA